MNRTTSPVLILALAATTACARHHGDAASLGNLTVPRFDTRIEIPTGTAIHSDYVVADFNGDQNLDMVVIGLPGELQVMIGSGAVFHRGQTLVLGGSPIWITAGDFDRDGDRDLAVVRTDADATVLWNDGNAEFTVGPSLSVGADALAVVVADANADGLLDVVVSRPYSPEIVVYDGDGNGGFAPGPSIALPGGGVPFTIAVGDVTHDGFADLVVSDPASDRVLIYAGDGPSTDFAAIPTELSVPGEPKACALGDLTGDGLDDIAVSAFAARQIVVVTGFDTSHTGPVAFTSFTLPVEAPPSLCTIGDVTGDGLNDLVACLHSRATVVIAPQLPGGGLGPPFQLDATGMPLRPFLGDADRNGRTDLFVLSGLGDRINLWLARSSGELVGARNWDTGLVSASFAAGADLDGDGIDEILVGGLDDSVLAVMKRLPDGRMVAAGTVDLGRFVFNVRAFDLDRDGKKDLIVPVDNGVKLVHNRSTPGDFVFDVLPGAGSESFGVGLGPFGVAAADLNRDGHTDLAIADFASGELQLLLGGNDPFEFTGAPRMLSIGGGPVDVVAGDFTGDGILDLAVSRLGQSDVLLLRNDGDANLSLFVSLPVGTAPNYLITADFNRDGRSDLVVSNGPDATVSVLFGGSQGFTTTSYPSGRGPTALLSGDFTNDGFPDILVASLGGGDFRVLINDGRGSFPGVFPFPGTLGASSAVLADLDGDGDQDLAIASLITNRLSVVTSLIH